MRPVDAALTAFGADPRCTGLVSGLHIAPAGGPPDSPLTHVAVQTEAPGTGAVCWQEQAEDAHWLAATR
jgi:hypothetical protein